MPRWTHALRLPFDDAVPAVSQASADPGAPWLSTDGPVGTQVGEPSPSQGQPHGRPTPVAGWATARLGRARLPKHSVGGRRRGGPQVTVASLRCGRRTSWWVSCGVQLCSSICVAAGADQRHGGVPCCAVYLTPSRLLTSAGGRHTLTISLWRLLTHRILAKEAACIHRCRFSSTPMW